MKDAKNLARSVDVSLAATAISSFIWQADIGKFQWTLLPVVATVKGKTHACAHILGDEYCVNVFLLVFFVLLLCFISIAQLGGGLKELFMKN